MARTQTQTRTQTQAQTPLPKSSLGGAPGANTQGGNQNQGSQNGGGGQQTLNRSTRRAIVRAQEAARSGDARLAAQILASIPGVTTGATGGQNNTQQNNTQQNNTQRTQTPQQTQARQMLPANLAALSNLSNVNSTAYAQLIRSMPTADASRAENLSAVVLLTALREMDLTALSTADVFNLCRQSLTIGITFTAMSSTAAPPLNAEAVRAAQQTQQTQQTQTGSRAARRANRRRQAQHA